MRTNWQKYRIKFYGNVNLSVSHLRSFDCKRGDNFINNQCNQTVDTQTFFSLCPHSSISCSESHVHIHRLKTISFVTLFIFFFYSVPLLLLLSLLFVRYYIVLDSNLFCLYKFHVRLYFQIRWLLCSPSFSISSFRWIRQLCVLVLTIVSVWCAFYYISLITATSGAAAAGPTQPSVCF